VKHTLIHTIHAEAGMKKLLKYVLLLAAACIIMLQTGGASAQLKFKGYVENRLYMTVLDNDFNPSDFNSNLRWGDYNRARVELSKDVSDNSYINLTVDHFVYSGYLLQLLRQPDTGENPVEAADEQRLSIDRAYVRLYLSKADVTIGKQRISWGQSLLWSPFDVFNRVNFLEPQEEKSGVNALRINIPLGVTASLQGIFAPETTNDESRAGVRVIWNMLGTEFTATAVHNVINTFRQKIAGMSFKTDVIIGFWLEGAFFDEVALPGQVYGSQSYFRWLAGADYSYDIRGKKLYLMTEYTHDESGEPDKENYNYLAARSSGRSLMARDYVYGSAQLSFSDYTSISAAVLANLNDGGMILMPSVRHSLYPNTEFTLGMYTAVADRGAELNPLPQNDPYNYVGNSMIYCWLRLYF